MSSESWQKMLQFLEETAGTLRRLDKEATDSLHEKGDEDRYRKLHQEKTELLLSLPERAAAQMLNLPPALNQETERILKEFSFDARRAKQKDSIFYMSVLLYPEEGEIGAGLPNAFDQALDYLKQVAQRIEPKL